MNKTKIAWTEYSWNPITGCTQVSEGCRNCYAKAVHERFDKTGEPFSQIVFHFDRLDEPLKLKKPSMIFVGSMTDIFHQDVDYHEFRMILNTIEKAPQHIFLILTKRPKRMKKYFEFYYTKYEVLKNVWIGVTVENQASADERIPLLIDTPAAKRFLSVEPLLEEVNLRKLHRKTKYGCPVYPCSEPYLFDIDRVIIGGESGAKSNGSEMKPESVARS